MFGTDSSFNETAGDFNILTTVYKEVKKHCPTIGVSLNFIEIGYNEQDQSELVIDLLDFSCKLAISPSLTILASKDTSIGSYDLQGFTTVAVRSVKELESVLNVV